MAGPGRCWECGRDECRGCGTERYMRRLEDDLEDAHTALRELLTWAERYRADDPTLPSEEWFAVRDYAQQVLDAPKVTS